MTAVHSCHGMCKSLLQCYSTGRNYSNTKFLLKFELQWKIIQGDRPLKVLITVVCFLNSKKQNTVYSIKYVPDLVVLCLFWPCYQLLWDNLVSSPIFFRVTALTLGTSVGQVSLHYSVIIMGAMASQITNILIVYSTLCSGTDQRKHQSSMPLAFVWGIHQWPVNSPHKEPVTRKMFPFDDIIMEWLCCIRSLENRVLCILWKD